jgi:hypothetical protein
MIGNQVYAGLQADNFYTLLFYDSFVGQVIISMARILLMLLSLWMLQLLQPLT